MNNNEFKDFDILMVKKNPKQYPQFNLPKNYKFIKYKTELKKEWIKLHYLIEEFDTIKNAEEYFEKEFMVKKDELAQKMVFVKNIDGDIVGTVSLWDGNHFNEVFQRIHWLAVHPKHQGKGIGKALVTKVFDIFQKLNYDNFIYLSTQTRSYKAINIYLDFGFKIYFKQ